MKRDFLSVLFSKKIPFAISVVFHPLLMPTIGILILFNSGIPVSFISGNSKNVILLVIILCTFCIPGFLLPLFYFRSIRDLFHDEKKSRLSPLLMVFVSYYLGFYILNKMQAPQIIQVFVIATVFSVFITLLFTIFWRISAHMIGIGGIVGLISVIMFIYGVSMVLYLVTSLVISGAIGSSRLSLNSHTPLQVYAGFLTGLLVMVGTFFFI